MSEEPHNNQDAIEAVRKNARIAAIAHRLFVDDPEGREYMDVLRERGHFMETSFRYGEDVNDGLIRDGERSLVLSIEKDIKRHVSNRQSGAVERAIEYINSRQEHNPLGEFDEDMDAHHEESAS